jgi:DNA-binding transcriptional LysR family regulator
MSDVLQMKALAAAVREGSLAGAGRRLDLSRSQVSKLIQALEQRLGVALLVRSNRSLALTDVGRDFHERIVDILARLAEAEQAIAGQQQEPQGPLRVNAPMTFGARLLAPLLPGFLRRFPQVKVDLHLDDRILDPVQGGFDVTVRVAALADSSLVARRLCDVPRVLCASRGYLQARGELARPEELRGHACLHYGYLAGGSDWSLEGPGDERVRVAVHGALCSNNAEALQQAALGDAGIALLPRFVVADDLRRGVLREVLPGWEAPRIAAHALFVRAPCVPAKVRAFVDHVVAGLGNGASFPGTLRYAAADA